MALRCNRAEVVHFTHMTKDTFVIASIGLDERDPKVLMAMVALAKGRTPRFAMHEPTPDKKPADIVFVNADVPEAVQRWTAYLKLYSSKAKISSVLICEETLSANPEERTRYVKRPLAATRLLTMLEEVVVSELGYTAPKAFAEDLATSHGSADDEADSAAPGTGISALVVDDSLPVRIQMKKALQKIANRVDFAETGEEAENLIQKNKYDIVFLDVILPGVDGYDICKMIKSHPDKGKTPVIMLTSNSSPADRIKGKMAGCDTYLIKPVMQNIFQEVIHEYLNLE